LLSRSAHLYETCAPIKASKLPIFRDPVKIVKEPPEETGIPPLINSENSLREIPMIIVLGNPDTKVLIDIQMPPEETDV